MPIVMSANLSITSQTQGLFRAPIQSNGYQIILGSGAQLIGVA